MVDNGSSDDSVHAARELGASVIELGRNLGFSAANNEGLRMASGTYIAFVNPDVRGTWDDLGLLGRAIDHHGGLVSPQLVNEDGSLQPNGRGAPLLAHKVLHRLVPSRRENGYQVIANHLESKYVFWLMGAVVLGEARVLRELGGWDERFFLYYEDKDLSIRAWAAGIPVVVDGRVQWIHEWARDTRTLRVRPWLLELRSLIRFYTLYPEFLFSNSLARGLHPRPSLLSGSIADCV